jgi:phage terminase large subunit
LTKLLTVCDNYPGVRVLIVRKTRESLTETVLVTWENMILGRDHSVLTRSPTLRRVRQSYRFPNGSTVVVGGMDKPDKVLSSEWDVIYCPEVLDLSVTDWETLGSRLRSNVMPYQQIIADCNPTTPTHWMYRRQAAGVTKMYTSSHKDNPAYYDRVANVWTPVGEQYLARLNRMSGIRRKRFLEGVWASAEGIIYDGFRARAFDDRDAPGHLLPKNWHPPRTWERAWAIDWGWNNPTVLQMWALDADGRMYLYKEFYRTHTRAEQLGLWTVEQMGLGEPRPTVVVCDHDPEAMATFEKYSGLSTTPADKSDKTGGIEFIQERLERQADGKPRLFIRDGMHPMGSRDNVLDELGKPIGFVEEIASYIWDIRDPDRPKDMPLDKDNHAADAARYLGTYLEANHGVADAVLAANRANAGRTMTDRLPAGTFRKHRR